MATRRLQALQPQTGMDEQVLNDPDLSDALEELLEAKQQRKAANSAVRAARQDVDKGVERLELPEGHAVRVGRFRITRRHVPEREVNFTAEARSQIDIALVGE